MNKLVLVAPLLLATAAYERVADLFAPTAAPIAVAAASAQASRISKPFDPASTATVADVVTAANAFIATLSTAQQTTLLQTFNSTNVTKWSNLPCGSNCRIGLQLSNLTTAQQTAAMAVVQAATGTVTNDGFNEIQQIRAADDNLAANGGGSGYSSGLYFIAFLGTPSATGTWMLQFGGHHLATNITFGGGAVTGATPKFEGVEPLSFTTANSNVLPSGNTYTPMANEASTMLAMLNGLTTAQKTTAKLSQTFNDVALGPGQDGNFPTTKVGLQVGTLTADQQALVVAAMKPWVQDSDDATAATLISTYTNQLADTYISYSGTGNFTTNGDYARIDGPNVWIEFVCQSGVVYRSQIHYHSIWRDRARDYGGNFYTTVTGTKAAAAAAVFSVYPNPSASDGSLQVQLAAPATAATYTLRNVLGQTVATRTFSGRSTSVPTAGLTAGNYVLSVQVAGQTPVSRHVVLQ